MGSFPRMYSYISGTLDLKYQADGHGLMLLIKGLQQEILVQVLLESRFHNVDTFLSTRTMNKASEPEGWLRIYSFGESVKG